MTAQMTPAAAGDGTTGEIAAGFSGRHISEAVEPGEADGAAQEVSEGDEPAGSLTVHLVQHDMVHEQGRGDAKGDDVCQRVEFAAEGRFDADSPRDAAIQEIEKAGSEDQEDGVLHCPETTGILYTWIVEKKEDGKRTAEEVSGGHEIRPEVDFGQFVFHE